ncbi:unnamed protein product [Allacma fusca]|uniref:Uncharacterized protein n=1 Tax=Allacma fusca TaxID=39272 RepID=A0A8J2JZL8_9HEXA|nr:unnamed protein product [Allacma fusca]
MGAEGCGINWANSGNIQNQNTELTFDHLTYQIESTLISPKDTKIILRVNPSLKSQKLPKWDRVMEDRV